MCAGVDEKFVGFEGNKLAVRGKRGEGFTLVELLTVMVVMSLLMGILLPTLRKARDQARAVQNMSNQKQIVSAANCFAADNSSRYPESAATITFGNNWGWQEPTMMIACKRREPQVYRSVSEYLRGYIDDASIMFCPSAPRKYEYLQRAWDAGDSWNNPDTLEEQDPVYGTYCFYWNYTGFLRPGKPFRGPQGSLGGYGQSKLLVSDYFGYDHWRSPKSYGSCERFRKSYVTSGTWVSSAYWSRLKSSNNINLDTLGVKLYAGYIDGHVGSFTASEVVPMKVSRTSDGRIPYPSGMGLGPGDFYLPGDGL